MTALAAAALAGLALAAAPAEPRPAPSAQADKPAPAANPAQRYCFKYEITGSILPQKTCKTLGEWKKQGIDPTAPQS